VSPLMQWLLIAWGVFTALLVVLLLYRSSLEMHEDDQIFLSEGEKIMEEEQHELQTKISRLQPYVRGLGTASAVLLLVMGVMFIYDGIQRLQ
jgi:hypothetical protein